MKKDTSKRQAMTKRYYTHEDALLNSLVGRSVKITLFDDTVYFGTLSRDEWRRMYKVNGTKGTATGQPYIIVFRKSHVKTVEVL